MLNEAFLNWALVVSVGVLLVGYLLMLYAAYFILPEIEKQLLNYKIVTDAKAFLGPYTHFGKMYRYSNLRLLLTSTRLLESKGMIDVQQVSELSRRHRQWIIYPSRFAGVGAVTMLVIGGLLKLGPSIHEFFS